MLGWLVEEKQIAPHVPVWDKSARNDGTLSISDFQWDEQANEYRCPEGHALRNEWRPFKNPRKRITKENTIIYTSSQHDCAACPKRVMVARTPRDARSPAVSMNRHGASHVVFIGHLNISAHNVSARRSRYSSHASGEY